MGSLIPKRTMKGDTILYNYNEKDLLGLMDVTVSFVFPKRELRRHNHEEKDNFPIPHTSCFRKGYHKFERDWKRESSRTRRHSAKMECRLDTDRPYTADKVYIW